MTLVRFIFVLASALLLAACAPRVKNAKPPEIPQPLTKTEPTLGETMIDRSQIVLETYSCGKMQRLPFALIEEQKTEPAAVVAGQSMSHYFVYVACPKDNNLSIPGYLSRKIYYRGRLQHNESKVMDFKAGRWGVRASIQVPESTKPGHYEIKVQFVSEPTKNNKNRVRTKNITHFDVITADQSAPTQIQPSPWKASPATVEKQSK